jgi:hypothetical protein
MTMPPRQSPRCSSISPPSPRSHTSRRWRRSRRHPARPSDQTKASRHTHRCCSPGSKKPRDTAGLPRSRSRRSLTACSSSASTTPLKDASATYPSSQRTRPTSHSRPSSVQSKPRELRMGAVALRSPNFDSRTFRDLKSSYWLASGVSSLTMSAGAERSRLRRSPAPPRQGRADKLAVIDTSRPQARQLRANHPLPPLPWRRPPSQQRDPHDCAQPLDPPPRNARLPRPPHQRRKDPPRGHARTQATHLPPPLQTTHHHPTDFLLT